MLKVFFNLLKLAIGMGLLAFLLPRLITALSTISYIYPVEDAPVRRVAVVFGAGLWRDGSPTPVLRDRVETAARLYFDGKVEKLLMSGDNSVVEYNEPEAMRQYALSLGVPDEDIVLDYAGRRTYDTCYRAKAIFQVEQPILVTQSFHLPRAVYTCRAMGWIRCVSRIYNITGADHRCTEPAQLPATLTALPRVYPAPRAGRASHANLQR
jgi:vancomycin permeability regulator SanA